MAQAKMKIAKRPRSARRLSTLDDFLTEQGKREEFEAVAMKEVSALAGRALSPCGRGQRERRSDEEWVRGYRLSIGRNPSPILCDAGAAAALSRKGRGHSNERRAKFTAYTFSSTPPNPSPPPAI